MDAGSKLHVVEVPKPFPAATGYEITVSGGTPPYTFTPAVSPPNPPGVVVTPTPMGCEVSVPPGTPPGTEVQVTVADSATPPNTHVSKNNVA